MKIFNKKTVYIFTFVASLLGVFYLIASFDKERQDELLLERVRANHKVLLEYKSQNNKYPDSLSQAGISEKYCLLLGCFNIKYKLSSDKQSYRILAKANYPYIVFFDSNCPNLPILEEEHRSICAQFGLDKSYTKNNSYPTDYPIYMEDERFFPEPSDWPNI